MKAGEIFLTSIVGMILCSCSVTTVQQTLYLGDVKVNAPITPPPTHVNIKHKAGDITVSPKFVINTNQKIVSNPDDSYRDVINLPDRTNYRTKDNNLEWTLPPMVAGVDFDAAATDYFSVFGGIHFSNTDKKDLVGGNFGIGIFSQAKNPAARFDIGISFQRYSYDAVTIVKTKTTTNGQSTEDMFLFHDRGDATNVNPFLSFSINSVNENSPLNYFFSLGYFTQKLLNFEPHENYLDYTLFGTRVYTTDLRTETMCGFFTLNPGFVYEFSDKMRFVCGVKILKEVLALKGYNDWVIIPAVQIDFQF